MEAAEMYQKNIEAYMKTIDRFWEFSPESREFILKRLQSDWVFPPGYRELFDTIEHNNDQRIRWNIDVTNNDISKIFSESDEGWKIFKKSFSHILQLLKDRENCNIGYNEYCNNKAMFRNNLTKIKKILETIYEANPDYSGADIGVKDKASIEAKIIKIFEQIGTVKKPVKRLQLVLSLNPVDWLLSSTASQVSSCLNLENGNGGHKYFAGLPFLCGDHNRAMLYVCDGEKKSYRGMEVDQTITRSWVLLNQNDKLGIIKWYCNEYFNLSAIQEITGIKRFVSHLGANGKYPLEWVYLKSGLMASIFNDDGGWRYDERLDKIIHDVHLGKGSFQVFYKNGTDVTNHNNLNFEKPYFIRESLQYKLTSFEDFGASYDNLVHRMMCPNCGEFKPVTVNQRSNHRKSICIDCYKDALFVCSDCGNTYDKTEMSYQGEAYVKGFKREVKLCSSCHSSAKKHTCQCCGILVGQNGYKETAEGEYVCISCLQNPRNGYKTCEVCDKVSNKSIKVVYSPVGQKLRQFCHKHLPDYKREFEEIRANNMFDSDREYIPPYVECPTCHNVLSAHGEPCILCQETHGYELEF